MTVSCSSLVLALLVEFNVWRDGIEEFSIDFLGRVQVADFDFDLGLAQLHHFERFVSHLPGLLSQVVLTDPLHEANLMFRCIYSNST